MRAEEYRAVADQMLSVAPRASYLSVAQTYEAMARSLEAASAHPIEARKEAD